MKIVPASRTEKITYAIRDVVVEANKLKKQGREILHLNIGDPNVYDFRTPQHMIDAVAKAMNENKNNYADSMGVMEAREAITRECGRLGIQNVTPEKVLLTAGSSEGIELAMTSLLNPGENILTPSPGYPFYTAVIHKIGAELSQYGTDEQNGWQPDIDGMKRRINEKTRGIVIINPNNPTGALYPKKTLEEIVDLANEHGLVIMADEIYNKLLFDGERHVPVASISDDVPVITTNGLAKNYLVPGWRIGWSIFTGKEDAVHDFREAVYKLARARLCAPGPAQYAVKPALEGPHGFLSETVKKLEERRNFIYERFNEMEGFSCAKPGGAFYAFPKIEFGMDDRKFVFGLLKEKQILTVFGTGFGYERPDHFRIVFLPPMETLRKAFDGMEEFASDHGTS